MKKQKQTPLRRIMLVSKGNDEHDYSHHLRRIANLADEHGCELLVYSLASFGNGGGQWYAPKRLLFGSSKRLQMVTLESCSWEGNGDPFTLEVWRRTERRPDVFTRKLARGSDSEQLKRSLVTEFPSRVYSSFLRQNVAHLICGEINCMKVKHDGKKRASDPFRLKRAIAQNNVKVLVNGWHTAARRFEINVKRRDLSRGKRWYLSVWNKKKGPEPERPWCAYFDGQNMTDKIAELPGPVIAARPDIRVAILSLK